MQKNKIILTLLLSPFFCLQDVSADGEDFSRMYDSDDVIAIVTGTQQPLHLAPSVASVINANTIQQMGATTLDEVLAHVPGIHVSVSPVRGFNTIYSIRGIHTAFTPQVLLTINGVPIRDVNTGSRISGLRIPVANISRVEVIRGPGSAVHGADAFAGVINVVTKSADELGGWQLGARLGSFASKDSWIQYGDTWQDWKVALSMEHSISDGDSSRRVASDLASMLGNSSLAQQYPLQTRFNILNSRASVSNTEWDISLSSWLQRDAGTGPGIAQAIDPFGNNEVAFYQFDVNHQFALDGWTISSRLNLQHETDDDRFMGTPPGTMMSIGDDGNLLTAPNSHCPAVTGGKCFASFTEGVLSQLNSRFDTRSFEQSALYANLPDHLIRLNWGVSQQQMQGSERRNFGPGTSAALVGDGIIPANNIWQIPGTLSDITLPNRTLPNHTRSSWYLAAQDEWYFSPDWTFTGGVRYDHFSDFGATVNPRLALVWAMNYNLTSKLLYGSAFRAPSFYELYAMNNPVLMGNAHLKPEKINTLELAFDYRPTFAWQHNFNTFYYQAEDMIAYHASNAVIMAQNLHTQHGSGFELESKWKPNHQLQASVAFARQNAHNQMDQRRIVDAPAQQLGASIFWKPASTWSIYSSAKRIMHRIRAANDLRPNIADYSLFSLSIYKQLSQKLEVGATIRNLFNTQAREPSSATQENNRIAPIAQDYPLEKRSMFIELKYQTDKLSR